MKRSKVKFDRQKAWSIRMLAAGRCATCGLKRRYGAKRFCPTHLAADAAKHRKFLGCKKWKSGGRGRPPLGR